VLNFLTFPAYWGRLVPPPGMQHSEGWASGRSYELRTTLDGVISSWVLTVAEVSSLRMHGRVQLGLLHCSPMQSR
jgi:hypothetical protein